MCVTGKGRFFAPTLLTECTHDMTVMTVSVLSLSLFSFVLKLGATLILSHSLCIFCLNVYLHTAPSYGCVSTFTMCMQEETFGPVLAVQPVDSDEQVCVCVHVYICLCMLVRLDSDR